MIYNSTFPCRIDATERAPPKSQHEDIIYRRLIETELLRERLYTSLVNEVKSWLLRHQRRLPWSEMQVSHLLLRYIFNKKATIFQSSSDPVFVIGISSIARQQLGRDLAAIQLTNALELTELIDDELARAASEMRTTKIMMDDPVILSPSINGKLIYRERMQEDFSQLAQRYGPDRYHAAYALGVRYSYLRLAAHGLSRAYKEETKLSPNDRLACECFASAFNHYFDQYYSAFPDLETFFGSRGCFFKADWKRELQGMTYYLNPPFDASLINLCVDRVFEVLKGDLVSEARFIFTVPGSWTDFPALEKLKKSPWTVKITDYQKGKLPFIDYMAKEGCRIIYPTDICEVILTNAHEDEFY